jgi:hypothetical protein
MIRHGTENTNILASFDIGIKNMAICVFQNDQNSKISIQEWKVLNLTEENSIVKKVFTCSCIEESKKKKLKSKKIKEGLNESKEPSFCMKPAKFKIANQEYFFCSKHAKNQTEYLLPTAIIKPTALKKMEVNQLQELCQKYGIQESVQKKTKGAYIDRLNTHFHEKSLITLLEKKTKSSEIDLVTIGRNMTKYLDAIQVLKQVTHVIIENQISPIANRMKTIQGMLTQYFIMSGSNQCKIEYISSINKLKSFLPNKQNQSNIPVGKEETETGKETEKKEKYKQNKKNGIEYTKELLDTMPEFAEWKSCLDGSNKQDDLADAFLQGIWYIQNKIYQ